MQDCRAIVALCLYRFGVLRQGADGIVPCRDQTLLLGRIASRGGGGGCLDSVVQLSGIFLERRLKSGVRHDSLSDAGGWRGELSNTHNVLLDLRYRCRVTRCVTIWRFCVTCLSLLHLQRSEEHTSELQSPCNLVCRLLL